MTPGLMVHRMVAPANARDIVQESSVFLDYFVVITIGIHTEGLAERLKCGSRIYISEFFFIQRLQQFVESC